MYFQEEEVVVWCIAVNACTMLFLIISKNLLRELELNVICFIMISIKSFTLIVETILMKSLKLYGLLTNPLR